MNPIAFRLLLGWAFAVGVLALTDLVVFPALGLFAWFPFAAVLWFGGFLAVVVGLIYVIGSMLGYTQAASGSSGRQSRQSKGARER
jgi:hypothetical protein